MKEKKNRRLKVYGQSNGYNDKDVPTIVLKGKWLEAAGFDIGPKRSEDAFDIDTGVGIKPRVLGGNKGLLEVRGDLG